jgi:hypothetical protein
MLPTNLNTNEVKDNSGTEIEFTRYLSGPGASLTFKGATEGPNTPFRLTVSHKEIGEGSAKRRWSVVRFDRTVDMDDVSTGAQLGKITAYTVVDLPVGLMSDFSEANAVVAALVSFLASKGASTTILYDCTGYGAEALINGSL